MFPREPCMVFGSHETRENVDTAGSDREVVKAAAVWLPAILQYANAPPLGAIGGGEFFKADNTMRDAMNGLVCGFRGEIVQKQDRGAMTGEVVLEGKDLAPVAK